MLRAGCLLSFRSSFYFLLSRCCSRIPGWACRIGLLHLLWYLSADVCREGVDLSFGSRMVRGSVLLAVVLVFSLGSVEGLRLCGCFAISGLL